MDQLSIESKNETLQLKTIKQKKKPIVITQNQKTEIERQTAQRKRAYEDWKSDDDTWEMKMRGTEVKFQMMEKVSGWVSKDSRHLNKQNIINYVVNFRRCIILIFSLSSKFFSGNL